MQQKQDQSIKTELYKVSHYNCALVVHLPTVLPKAAPFGTSLSLLPKRSLKYKAEKLSLPEHILRAVFSL